MKTFSSAAEKEIRELSRSIDLGKEMESIANSRHNPFVKNGGVDVDAYLDFVSDFNAFINHEPKPFVRMSDQYMRL